MNYSYIVPMKSWITTLLLSFICCLTMYAQSSTYTFEPTFEKHHQEYISEIVDFEIAFEDVSFVGISAYHFDADYRDIQYRVLHGEQWSRWEDFSPQHDVNTRVRTAYQGDWILSACSALQFKSNEAFDTALKVRLFVAKKQKTNNISPQISMDCPLPAACLRSCWCATCPIDATPELTTPTHIIVHHSAGSNVVLDDYKEVVHFIWDLHVNTNGWDDIGYNWLIDPNGVLYEGRPDGYQGAHFSCINENTVGVCMLGDFTSVTPTTDAVNTLIGLVAYEATDHNIDVLSEAYHVTGEFDLTTVAGHRDSSGSPNSCSNTVCPGESFYPMLDQIRNGVANLACYQGSVSTMKTLNNKAWYLYPNPAKNFVSISGVSSNDLISIYGADGTVLDEFMGSNQSIILDISDYKEGVYFIQVTNLKTGNSSIKKFVKL